MISNMGKQLGATQEAAKNAAMNAQNTSGDVSRRGMTVSNSSRGDVSLRGLKTNPQFLASCEYVQLQVANKDTPPLALADLTLYGNIDVTDRVTAVEMPIERGMGNKIEFDNVHIPTELFLMTRQAHSQREPLDFFVDMYNNYRLTSSGAITLNGVVVTPSEITDLGKLEAFYLRIKLMKYHLYNESNNVVRTHYQRVNTFLVMCLLARFWKFASAGTAPVKAPVPLTADTAPLLNLLILCRSVTDTSSNTKLQEIANLSMETDASESSKLVSNLRKTQTALQRATTSIQEARRLRRDQEIQLVGYSLLTIACVSTFYGLYVYKNPTWVAYKYHMSIAAALGAMVILLVTLYSIFKPVERFESYYEQFCTDTADTCTEDMNKWATEATKQTYLTVADGTTRYAKDLLTSRNESMSEELHAITRRVNATDIEYREDMYMYNRVRQIKRFVIMSFVVALFLMSVTASGVSIATITRMHVFAAVIICITGVLVYRGNSQRMRKNFHQIYYPKPEFV